MDDAVTNSDRQGAAKVLAKDLNNLLERLIWRGQIACGPMLIFQKLPSSALHNEVWINSNSFNLPLDAAVELLAMLDCK